MFKARSSQGKGAGMKRHSKQSFGLHNSCDIPPVQTVPKLEVPWFITLKVSPTVPACSGPCRSPIITL